MEMISLKIPQIFFLSFPDNLVIFRKIHAFWINIIEFLVNNKKFSNLVIGNIYNWIKFLRFISLLLLFSRNNVHTAIMWKEIGWTFTDRDGLSCIPSKRKQECIPVGCVLPARNRMGGGLPDRHTPRQRPTLDRDPRDRDPLGRDSPGQRPPPGQRSPVNKITDRCKYITVTSLRAIKKKQGLLGSYHRSPSSGTGAQLIVRFLNSPDGSNEIGLKQSFSFQSSDRPCSLFEGTERQQGSIPVKCVPPALVATTRCKYLGGRYLVYLPPWVYPLPEWTWDQRYLPPHKGPGTRDTCPHPLDRHTRVKTLPSRNFVAGGNVFTD